MSYHVVFRPECFGCRKQGLVDVRDGVVTFYDHWVMERKVTEDYTVRCRYCDHIEKMKVRVKVDGQLIRESI